MCCREAQETRRRKKNTISEIRALKGTEQKTALGLALYPIVSRYQPDKAGIILTMMMEMDVSTLLGFVIDPPSVRGVIAEAMRVINGPSASDSRLPTYTGSNPSSTTTTLGDVDLLQEGDHDNVEEEES